MSSIAERLNNIKSTLPPAVGLVAVSKFHPAEAIAEAYSAGQRTFGESRVQELLAKQPVLPADIDWHFIGHLQTNKARQIIGRTALIESVDSLRLLELIDDLSAKAEVITRVLLEVHVAVEESKYGFSPEEILEYFNRHGYENLRATHICGIMGMASNTDDTARVRADFEALASIFNQIKEMCPDLRGFDTLSMGMSDDYPVAVEAGATLVRVGSSIFGPR